ncbi:chlorite dismutase family protein [Synechococcus sp. Cruz CV-v-12]|uniref:chlorite dismutase family protein n=1 Tax=Synechococcus sp. Cruz CV-v-12 TaxID=2823728 RepID=UPI0020CDC4AC|nr:chlorite dismutase family protein [Synechococcus sp. Cruz CV-v-12]
MTHAFVAGPVGHWRIDQVTPVVGAGLASAQRLDMLVDDQGRSIVPAGTVWTLSGVTSNTRYANRAEVDTLRRVQAGLGRPEATRAALIPIRKSAAWWSLAQDERRAIFEEQSRHTAIGLEYLPAIARRLIHCRDQAGSGGSEFDFLTWFEYAPEHAGAFEELVNCLRDSREWTFVDREVDVRLSR